MAELRYTVELAMKVTRESDGVVISEPNLTTRDLPEHAMAAIQHHMHGVQTKMVSWGAARITDPEAKAKFEAMIK